MSGAINRSGTLRGSSHCQQGQWQQVRVTTDDLQVVNQATLKLKESTGSFQWVVF